MEQKLNPSDIFADVEKEIKDLIDPEEIINIDLEAINEASEIEAAALIKNLTKFYYDEEFLKNQPEFKKRVDNEIETLRINLKMRKADECAHDILIKNIAQNPNNASLYRALTELQKTVVNITTKIEDTITRLNNMMKSYQLELNFEQQEETDDGQVSKSHRGTKAFIEELNNRISAESSMVVNEPMIFSSTTSETSSN